MANLQRLLLDWYDQHHRQLPWRAEPGNKPNPYHVWLSEVMLQQTTVVTIIPYFQRFIEAFPTLEALATANQDDVLTLWQGLGYYSRARNLHKCAAILAQDFPEKASDLRELPGIGTYSSASIAAIAFNKPAVPVDGNVVRVTARLWGLKETLPRLKQTIEKRIDALLPQGRFGDFAQALMELGALVCKPKKPACSTCPWEPNCRAHALGIAESLPKKEKTAAKPVRHGVAFILKDSEGRVLLCRRPSKGLLARMMGVPTTPWEEEIPSEREIQHHAPLDVAWVKLEKPVQHIFTHFKLILSVWVGQHPPEAPLKESVVEGVFVPKDQRATYPLPTVMKKVISRGEAEVSTAP